MSRPSGRAIPSPDRQLLPPAAPITWHERYPQGCHTTRLSGQTLPYRCAVASAEFEFPDHVLVATDQVRVVIVELEAVLDELQGLGLALAERIDMVIGRIVRWVWPLLGEMDEGARSMARVVLDDTTVSLAEAARLLALDLEEVVRRVFTRGLPSVAAPSGRRVITRDEIRRQLEGTVTAKP